MFDFTVIARPRPVMPVGNPVQYVFETDRTTRPEVDVYSCSITGLQYSYVDNNVLTIDVGGGAPVSFSWIEIAGDRYTFAPCADLVYNDSPYYINLSPFLLSGDFCDLADEIVDAINNNPDAQNRYFAVRLGGSLDLEPPGVILTNASTCSATSLTIRIVASRIDLDLNVSQSPSDWPAYPGTTPWLGPTRTPARNYFTNYRMYLHVWQESGDYRFGSLAQSKKLTALPVPPPDNLQATPRLWVEFTKRFVFDLAAELRAYLGHDVPDLAETKIRFCFRCLKLYYIKYGDQKDGVGDGSLLEDGDFVSRMRLDTDVELEEGELIVLNALLPLYDSDFAARHADNGAACIETESAPFLLQRYFRNSSEPRDFLFVTSETDGDCNTAIVKPQVHQEGGPLWLHWWLGFEFAYDDGLLKLWARYHYDNGSMAEMDTGFDFGDVGNCEIPNGGGVLNLLQIPAHAALTLSDVSSFEVWMEYNGNVVSNELSFINYEACDALVCLVFVNRFGVFQCLYYEGAATLTVERESETYEATRLGLTTPRHAPHNRGKTTHYVTQNRVWELNLLNTGLASEDVMSDLAFSPDVRLVWQGELIPVVLDTNDWPIVRVNNSIELTEFTIIAKEAGEQRYG